MSYKVSVTPQAEEDISETFQYIAIKSEKEIALRWFRKLKGEVQSLTEMPNRFSICPESEKFGFQLRQLVFGSSHRVIYRVNELKQEVHVLAVRHTARDELRIEDIRQTLKETD